MNFNLGFVLFTKITAIGNIWELQTCLKCLLFQFFLHSAFSDNFFQCLEKTLILWRLKLNLVQWFQLFFHVLWFFKKISLVWNLGKSSANSLQRETMVQKLTWRIASRFYKLKLWFTFLGRHVCFTLSVPNSSQNSLYCEFDYKK